MIRSPLFLHAAAMSAVVCGFVAARVPSSLAGGEAGTAAWAKSVLTAHCSGCHQAGQLAPAVKAPSGGIGAILDLETLAARDDLVMPGDPDASRLYHLFLSRHRPGNVFGPDRPAPLPPDIEHIRNWISVLQPRTPDCSGRALLTPARMERDTAAWRRAFSRPDQPTGRFLSLAALSRLCRTDRELAAYRRAASDMLARLSKTGQSPEVESVGADHALLAFHPADLGWTLEAWDRLADAAQDVPGVTEADALAARILSSPPPEWQAAWASDELIDGLDPVAALASEYQRVVTLRRAEAEWAGTGTRLDKVMTSGGEAAVLALRLKQTGLPRVGWERLKATLTGLTRRWPPASDAPLAVWTGRSSYGVGDLLTVSARTVEGCGLTLVAIEPDGLATVLFPNDTATDNRAGAGEVVTVPQPGAPFQLRLDKEGRHHIAAICTAAGARPVGIGHDFDRQRFTSLGDWRTFLGARADRETAFLKVQEDLRRFRPRGQRTSGDRMPDSSPASGVNGEVWTGLSFEVR